MRLLAFAFTIVFVWTEPLFRQMTKENSRTFKVLLKTRYLVINHRENIVKTPCWISQLALIKVPIMLRYIINAIFL